MRSYCLGQGLENITWSMARRQKTPVLMVNNISKNWINLSTRGRPSGCESQRLNPLGVEQEYHKMRRQLRVSNMERLSLVRPVPRRILACKSSEKQEVETEKKRLEECREGEGKRWNRDDEHERKGRARESSILKHVRTTATHVPTSKTDGEWCRVRSGRKVNEKERKVNVPRHVS
jgi:hypothetical protein